MTPAYQTQKSMTSQAHFTVKSLFKGYLKNSSGAMAVWAAAAAPVLLGGAALSVDAARLYNMDQDLQAAADALARAGAAELDQRSDSLTRAQRAMNTLIRNDQKFGSGGAAAITIKEARYLKAIPDQDYMPSTSAHLASSASAARFVEVEVTPQSVSTVFPQGLVRAITSVSLSARSTAGFSQSVCGVAPVFVCNPFEYSTETTLYEAMEDPDFRRRQIEFKKPGPNGRYGPGNFGWLDFADGGGASAMRDALAIDKPDICLSKSAGVKLRPGNIASMRHAMNVRFDIYDGPMKSKTNDPAYAPAANVVKGYVAKSKGKKGKDYCDVSPSYAALGLPRDSSFGGNSCYPQPKVNKKKLDAETGLNARVGNGDWDFISYMAVNHNYMSPITIDDVTYHINYRSRRMSPQDPPSRYGMYRWEIDNNCVPGALTYGNSARTPEEGLPQCHKLGAYDGDVDRRIIHAAVLNCGALEASGVSMAGRTDALPVETFVKVFVTEPMGRGQNNTIYGEIVGPVIQGEDSVSRDKVALSR